VKKKKSWHHSFNLTKRVSSKISKNISYEKFIGSIKFLFLVDVSLAALQDGAVHFFQKQICKKKKKNNSNGKSRFSSYGAFEEGLGA
jgi:hypothetical protein